MIHQLVGHAYSLVKLGMADYRLARQMQRRYCTMFFYYCVAIMNYAKQTLCPLSVYHLQRRWWATLYLHVWFSTLAFCICDFIADRSIASYQEIF